jgi:hypothetical protein
MRFSSADGRVVERLRHGRGRDRLHEGRRVIAGLRRFGGERGGDAVRGDAAPCVRDDRLDARDAADRVEDVGTRRDDRGIQGERERDAGRAEAERAFLVDQRGPRAAGGRSICSLFALCRPGLSSRFSASWERSWSASPSGGSSPADPYWLGFARCESGTSPVDDAHLRRRASGSQSDSPPTSHTPVVGVRPPERLWVSLHYREEHLG